LSEFTDVGVYNKFHQHYWIPFVNNAQTCQWWSAVINNLFQHRETVAIHDSRASYPYPMYIWY